MNEKWEALRKKWMQGVIEGSGESFTEFLVRQISGTEPEKPDFRSEMKQTKITVKPRPGGRQSSTYYTSVTDEALRDRARKATDSAQSDDIRFSVEVAKGLIAALEERVNILDDWADRMIEWGEGVDNTLDALEESVAAKQPKKTTITFNVDTTMFKDTDEVMRILKDTHASLQNLLDKERR